jgi:hypothetical protein
MRQQQQSGPSGFKNLNALLGGVPANQGGGGGNLQNMLAQHPAAAAAALASVGGSAITLNGLNLALGALNGVPVSGGSGKRSGASRRRKAKMYQALNAMVQSVLDESAGLAGGLNTGAYTTIPALQGSLGAQQGGALHIDPATGNRVWVRTGSGNLAAQAAAVMQATAPVGMHGMQGLNSNSGSGGVGTTLQMLQPGTTLLSNQGASLQPGQPGMGQQQTAQELMLRRQLLTQQLAQLRATGQLIGPNGQVITLPPDSAEDLGSAPTSNEVVPSQHSQSDASAAPRSGMSPALDATSGGTTGSVLSPAEANLPGLRVMLPPGGHNSTFDKSVGGAQRSSHELMGNMPITPPSGSGLSAAANLQQLLHQHPQLLAGGLSSAEAAMFLTQGNSQELMQSRILQAIGPDGNRADSTDGGDDDDSTAFPLSSASAPAAPTGG